MTDYKPQLEDKYKDVTRELRLFLYRQLLLSWKLKWFDENGKYLPYGQPRE